MLQTERAWVQVGLAPARQAVVSGGSPPRQNHWLFNHPYRVQTCGSKTTFCEAGEG